MWGGPEQNTLNTKHLNCQPLRSFSPVKPVHHQQTHANVKRTGSFPDKAEEYAPVVSLQGVIPRRYALQFLLPSTAPCKSYRARVQRMALRHLVQFLRLHRATLCRFSCLIPEGCRLDPAGFSGPYSGVLCHPFEGHCCRPSAPDTSTTALTALKSTSCILVGLPRRSSILRAAQLHIRHFVLWPALRASSELVLPSPSRLALQTCPSACPCPGSSPITRCVANHADPGAV